MASKGEKTRQQLLEVGARIIAHRGINGASSREIVKAAGQRNTGALQYYFGSTHGLVEAIVAAYRARLGERRQQLLKIVIAESRTGDLRSLLEVIFVPLAELLDGVPHERAFISIATQLMMDPEVAFEEFLAMGADRSTEQVAHYLAALELDLPRDILSERIPLALIQATHAFAYRARLEDAEKTARPLVPRDLFIANVIDMAAAAIAAPSSHGVAWERRY